MQGFVGLFACVFLAIGALTANSLAAAPAKMLPASSGKPIPDQYIVVLKDGASPRSVAAVASVRPKHVYESALNGFAAALNAGQLAALQRHPSVDYIEQDREFTIAATQTVGAGQWGLDRIDQRALPLNGSYSYTATGAGVTAYIISTGILPSHADFGGRAAIAFDAYGGSGTDCNGWGTHLAGVVGGTTYGVAKSVNLRGVRVLNCSYYGDVTGTYAALITGLDWVSANAVRPAAAVVVSAASASSSAVYDALTRMLASGIFVTVPAGDSGGDACSGTLASHSGVYTATASDRNDYRPAFANYGSCVDIYAPGVSITSAWNNGGTSSFTSTIVSAGHVLGCVAKYKSAYGEAAPSTIATWLNSNATTGAIRNNLLPTPNRLLYCPL
ncbi:MAG TPA: S8 family peptidase [Herpetosiphonaceae bacterium]